MDFNNMVQIQLMLLSLILLGTFLKKKKVITKEGNKLLADLVMTVTLPCTIFKSFQMEFTVEILKSCLAIFVLGFVIQALIYLFNMFAFNYLPWEKKSIMQYSTLTSNAGTLGNAVTEGIFGSLGVLYSSFYLISQRTMMWSVGLTYFTKTDNRKNLIKKIATNPCMISVVLGLLAMIFQIHLPGFLNLTIKNLASANTPIAMMLVGGILADVPWKELIDKDTLYFTAIRLVLLPAVVYVLCMLFSMEGVVKGVAVALAAMPAASVVPAVSSKYGADSFFATKCLVFSTVCSLVTLPIWCIVLAM